MEIVFLDCYVQRLSTQIELLKTIKYWMFDKSVQIGIVDK